MNAYELADWFDGRILYLWDAENGQYYDSAIADELVPTLRQQESRIEQLLETQDYLYKTHDADKAEIEALKKELALWRLSKSSEEIESIPSESDKFCDTHCVWTDHHPECKHAKYRR